MSADAPERGVHVLSDGTEISFRALTIAERDRLAKIQAGVSPEIADEILASEALVIVWTITTAVTSPSSILEILFAGMEAGRIADGEMIDLPNAVSLGTRIARARGHGLGASRVAKRRLRTSDSCARNPRLASCRSASAALQGGKGKPLGGPPPSEFRLQISPRSVRRPHRLSRPRRVRPPFERSAMFGRRRRSEAIVVGKPTRDILSKLRRAAFWGFEIIGVMLVVAALVVFLVAQYSSATPGRPAARFWIAASMARQRLGIDIHPLVFGHHFSALAHRSFWTVRGDRGAVLSAPSMGSVSRVWLPAASPRPARQCVR